MAAFYKDKMKENGWEAKLAMDTGDGTLLSGTKDHRTQNAVIRRDGSKTEINLTVIAEER